MSNIRRLVSNSLKLKNYTNHSKQHWIILKLAKIKWKTNKQTKQWPKIHFEIQLGAKLVCFTHLVSSFVRQKSNTIEFIVFWISKKRILKRNGKTASCLMDLIIEALKENISDVYDWSTPSFTKKHLEQRNWQSPLIVHWPFQFWGFFNVNFLLPYLPALCNILAVI